MIKNSRKYLLVITVFLALCLIFAGFSIVTFAAAVPDPAILSVDNPNNTGNYTITINDPAGNSATSLHLYENNVMVFSRRVKAGSTTDQIFTYPVTNKPNGIYTYYVITQNSAGNAVCPDLTVTVGPSGPSPTPSPGVTPSPMPKMFDDFNYTSSNDSLLGAHGWIVRSGSGGPGPAGCSWSPSNVTFLTDPDIPGNMLMRLTSSTGGAGNSTVQTEVYTSQLKYFAGTYAARVKFSDLPVSGSDGGAINETFFAISPLAYDNDPNYSELDFEYLANGGWGVSGPTMWCTSWYTYCNTPWSKDNVYNLSNTSYAGWHTLVITVGNGEINYYIDGNFKAKHTGKYYPRKNMSVNFNLWFLGEGPLTSSTYVEEIDWVFHVKDSVFTPTQVNDQVQSYRSQNIRFTDTVN